MKNSLNKPYLKLYNQDGTLSNPIVGQYPTQGDNRAERRRKNTPFLNNKKHWPLTVSGQYKYIRRVQLIFDKVTGAVTKKILHYLPR